jgi:spore coat protein U-like protein
MRTNAHAKDRGRFMLRNQNRLRLKVAIAAVCLLQFVSSALALTATTSFTTQIVTIATCLINSATTLDFGSQGVLAANVDQTSTVSVQCTDTTPYNIGLDAGTGTGATVAVRKMSNGANTIDYSLYSDSNRTTVWGNTVSTDTVAGTGNGTSQALTIYGRVTAQTTPAPGTYSDTVTVTVTY